MREIFINGMSGDKPQTSSYEALRALSKEKLTKGAFDYVDGSAGTERTPQHNADAFQKWQIGEDACCFALRLPAACSRYASLYKSPLCLAEQMLQSSTRRRSSLAVPFPRP